MAPLYGRHTSQTAAPIQPSRHTVRQVIHINGFETDELTLMEVALNVGSSHFLRKSAVDVVPAIFIVRVNFSPIPGHTVVGRYTEPLSGLVLYDLMIWELRGLYIGPNWALWPASARLRACQHD